MSISANETHSAIEGTPRGVPFTEWWFERRPFPEPAAISPDMTLRYQRHVPERVLALGGGSKPRAPRRANSNVRQETTVHCVSVTP